MIENGTIESSTDDKEDSKVFYLPSMSNIVLGARSLGLHGDDDDGSLKFEHLMNMKAPEGVDFHASYDEVPKAKVNITKKLKLGKNRNNSCPSFGYTNENEATEFKAKKLKMKRQKKSKRSQSAAAPSRSISFTAAPPSHLVVEVPKPLLPQRTKSMPMGYSIGSSLDICETHASRSFVSSGSAFQPHNGSSTSTAEWTNTSIDFATQDSLESLNQSLIILSLESREFTSPKIIPDKRKVLRTTKKNSTTSKVRRQSLRIGSPSAPLPSNSLDIYQGAEKNDETNAFSPRKNSTKEDTFAEVPSTPRHTPPPQSKSLDELAMAIFQSPIRCEVSKRAVPRRKSSQRVFEKAEVPRRKSVVAAQPKLLSPRRGLSPRRTSKRPALSVRSKSAKLVRNSDLITVADLEAQKSVGSSTLAPRRTKSVYSSPNTCTSSEKPRAQLKLPGSEASGRRFHDDVSVSASEAVPIASFAFSKHQPNRTHLKKSFKDTLDLVGKWKRKSKQEEKNVSKPLGAVDFARLHSKDNHSSAPRTWPTNREQSHANEENTRDRRKSKTKSSCEDVMIDFTTTVSENLSYSPREGQHSSRRKVDDSMTEDSLSDTLEAREARLETYLTKTPQMERKKVDQYWIEAFKRNYARRNDLIIEKPTPSKAKHDRRNNYNAPSL